MTEPATFHLVRHAAHSLLPHTLAGRMPGVPLSAEGVAQAGRLAERFAGQRVSLVVTSPVQRAQETAMAIAGRLGVVPVVDAGFEEIDFGAWTSRRFAELANDPAWQSWNRLRSLAACPGGESMHQAQSRALAALDRLRRADCQKGPGQAIIIVSHGDILKAIIAAAMGLSLDMLDRFSLDPASVSTLISYDDAMRVDGLNGRC